MFVFAQGAGGNNFLIPLILCVGVFMILSSYFNRRNQKQAKETLANLKKNDRVRSIGGIIGTVVSCSPEEVVVKVDESANVKITFIRSAIAQVLTDSPKAPDAAK